MIITLHCAVQFLLSGCCFNVIRAIQTEPVFYGCWPLAKCETNPRNQACLFNASALHMKIKKSWSRLFFPILWFKKMSIAETFFREWGWHQEVFVCSTDAICQHCIYSWDCQAIPEVKMHWSSETPVWDSCFHWIVATFGYGSIPIHTIFNGMNIHLPAILMFTRGTRFWPTAICTTQRAETRICTWIGYPYCTGRPCQRVTATLLLLGLANAVRWDG